MAVSFIEKLRDIILDLTLSKCNDTTEFISENMDHNISVFKRWRMGFHLALCKYCREYKAQLESLRQMALGLNKGVPDMAPQASLKPDSKERIKRIIEKKKLTPTVSESKLTQAQKLGVPFLSETDFKKLIQ